MERKNPQPPRMTSTPRICRNTFSLQDNLNGISPILPILAPVRKTKSMIPVFREPTQPNLYDKRRTVAAVGNMAPLRERNMIEPQPCSAKKLFSGPGSVVNNTKISQSSTLATKENRKTSLDNPCAVGNTNTLVMARPMSKLSAVCGKQSVLTSIPETSPAQDPKMKSVKNSADVLILKSSENNVPVVWNVLLQPKKVLSLKRKNNIDENATKTLLPTSSDAERLDESWFGSPEGLSRLENSIPQKTRKTYVIKKNTDENKENNCSKISNDLSGKIQNQSNDVTNKVILAKNNSSKKSIVAKNSDNLDLVENKTVGENRKLSLITTVQFLNSDFTNKNREPVNNDTASMNVTYRVKQTNSDTITPAKSSTKKKRKTKDNESNVKHQHTSQIEVVLENDTVNENNHTKNKVLVKINENFENNTQPVNNNENSETQRHKNNLELKKNSVVITSENDLQIIANPQNSCENIQNNIAVVKDKIVKSENEEITKNYQQLITTANSKSVRKHSSVIKKQADKENDYQQETEPMETRGRGRRPKRNTTVTPLNSNTNHCNKDNPKTHNTRARRKEENQSSIEVSSTKKLHKPEVNVKKVPAVTSKQKNQRKNETLAKQLDETNISKIDKETQPLESYKLTKSRKTINMSDEEKITLIKDMKKSGSDPTVKIGKGRKQSKPAQRASSQKSYDSKNQENNESLGKETAQGAEKIIDTVVANNEFPVEDKIKLTETTRKSVRKKTLSCNTVKAGKTSEKSKIVQESSPKECNNLKKKKKKNAQKSINKSLEKESVQDRRKDSVIVVTDTLPEEEKEVVKKTVVKQRVFKTKSHMNNKVSDEKSKEKSTDEPLNEETVAQTTERRNENDSKNTSSCVPQQVANKNVAPATEKKRKTRDADTTPDIRSSCRKKKTPIAYWTNQRKSVSNPAGTDNESLPEPKRTKGRSHNKKDKDQAPSSIHMKSTEPENTKADERHRETVAIHQILDKDKASEPVNKKADERHRETVAVHQICDEATEPENKQADGKKHRETEAIHQIRDKDVNTCFGLKTGKTSLLVPGVTMHTFMHKQNYVMTGCFSFETDASINKASTDTTYFVTQGAATVRLSKTTQIIRSQDVNNSFFIPKHSDFSITNEDKTPLKMLFTKFKHN